jgi:hypothetical protein
MKRVYYVSYSGYDHPEWNFLSSSEEELREFISEADERGWVRPDVYVLTIEDVEIYLSILGRKGLVGLRPEVVREALGL